MYPNSELGARIPKLSAAADIVRPPLPTRPRGAPALPPRIPALPSLSSPPPLPPRYQRAESSISSMEDISSGFENLHTTGNNVGQVNAKESNANPHLIPSYTAQSVNFSALSDPSLLHL